MSKQRNLLTDTEGATAIEYALLLVMIAAVIIGTVKAISQKMPGLFNVQF